MDFKKYEYKMQTYEIEESNETTCINEINSCFTNLICNKKKYIKS